VHPWRERLRAQLMLALYRSGRQHEALEAYRTARQAFSGEVGIEPGRELQQLEQAILRQDPALEAPAPSAVSRATPPTTVPAETGLKRGRLATALVLGGVLAALAVAVVALATRSKNPSVEPNSVGVIDPRGNRVVGSVGVGEEPVGIAYGSGAVWVANAAERTVSRIDPDTRREVKRIGTGWANVALTTGADSLWALDRTSGTLLRIDPRLNVAVARLDLRGRLPAADPVALAFGAGMLWIELSHGGVARLSPRSNALSGIFPGIANGGTLAVGFGSVWVPSVLPNAVRRFDIASRHETRIPLERAPTTVATGAGAVWVAVESRDEIWRIDPHTNAVTKTISVGDGPRSIAVGPGGVWVANALDGTVSHIDPAADAVVATIRLGGRPTAVALGAGAVWVAVRES
jgi:YVTN family beta-propeller protein